MSVEQRGDRQSADYRSTCPLIIDHLSVDMSTDSIRWYSADRCLNIFTSFQIGAGEKSIDNYHTIEKFEWPTFPSLEWKRKIKLPLTGLDVKIDSKFLVVHLRHFD